jgi:argininosuccinate lyase
MPQKRNPCSLEVIKAKTSFAHGILASLLSEGKALFMGYNRDTQWTKYWIMDLVDESLPALSVMTDIIRLLQVNKTKMLEQAQEGFAGATFLMEWMVRQGSLPLRKAKTVVEKAVKYSERKKEQSVSYESLRQALYEMNIHLPITQQKVEKVQQPEGILTQALSVGTPTEKGMRENITGLRSKVKIHRNWLVQKKRRIEQARGLVSKMEKQLSS